MYRNRGFTLLEVLIVVGIMAFIAAMVWPMRGVLDDGQREKFTIKAMDEIEQALMGHPGQVDAETRDRLIGGYLGDMHQWPELWEPGDSHAGPEGERGFFDGPRFRWKRPFVEVTETAAESLGQPRALWTRHLSDGSTPEVPDEQWRGPYLRPPAGSGGAPGSHYARNQEEYENLSSPDRLAFHLLQGRDQLTDGWGRAFRFFISRDPRDPGSDHDAVFWIVSLGADGRGVFPEGMEDMFDYDDDDPRNRDNLVRMLARQDWQPLLERQRLRSSVTERLIIYARDDIDRLVRALVGEGPSGPNTGYTGDMLAWPRFWNWVCRDADDEILSCDTPGATGQWEDTWIDPDFPDVEKPYKAGQPRGLWEKGGLAPFGSGNRPGVGWRHPYHRSPSGAGAGERLLDAWDRPLVFFLAVDEDGEEHLVILSGGPSGAYVLPPGAPGGNPPTDAEGWEHWTEPVSLAHYDPDDDANGDNIVSVVPKSFWRPGYIDLDIVVADDPGRTDCDDIGLRVYGVVTGSGDAETDGLPAETWKEVEPGDWTWNEENGACSLRLRFDDITDKTIISGGRYLLLWLDDNDNREPDPGERGWRKIIPVHAAAARIVEKEIILDHRMLQPLP